MLDIKRLREEPNAIAAAVKAKGVDADIPAILELDARRREALAEVERLKYERNEASKKIGQAKKEGRDAASEVESMRVVGDRISEMDAKIREMDQQLEAQLLGLPNPPHASVPEGASAEDNVVVRTWGQPIQRSFMPVEHKSFGEGLGLFDFERGAKISGSGFPVYTGVGAKLERALISYFLDSLSQWGFTEVMPPHLVTPKAMTGTGQLPKFADQLYHCVEDDLYLIPTAEVPVTNLLAEEVLYEKDLPVRYCAYTPCFRREAGSYGKDVRGFLRLHQFNKVEMVWFAHPDKSYEAHEQLAQYSEKLLQGLGLHYRVISLCKGDLGFGAAKCYDLEVWCPVENKWLEVSSVSNFEDFQARRANIKVKIGGKNQFLHTLNGSGLATPRVLVALLDHYQNEDGSWTVPEVLRPYMGGLEVIRKA
jgi:seryl-tRNA synthetase